MKEKQKRKTEKHGKLKGIDKILYKILDDLVIKKMC